MTDQESKIFEKSSYSEEKIQEILRSFNSSLAAGDINPFISQIDKDAKEYAARWFTVTQEKPADLSYKIQKRVRAGMKISGMICKNLAYRFLTRSDVGTPTYTIWTMLNQCNGKCQFCHDGGPNDLDGKYFKKDAPRPTKEAAWEALENISKNVFSIYFCGGEPFLFEETRDLVQEAGRRGLSPLFINTNGLLLGENLLDLEYFTGQKTLRNIDYFIVSLHSLNPLTSYKIFGFMGPEMVVNQLRYLHILKWLQPLGFKLMTNTVIFEGNIKETRDILYWGKEHDIRLNFVPAFYGKNTRPTVFNLPEYRPLIKEILDQKKQGTRVYGDQRMLEKLLLGKPYDCFPTVRPHIQVDDQGNYVIPLPCSGNPLVNVPLKYLNKESSLHLPLGSGQITLDLRGKGWSQVMSSLKTHGFQMSCPTGKCYLTQDLSTEILFKFERSVLFLLHEIYLDLRRYFPKLLLYWQAFLRGWILSKNRYLMKKQGRKFDIPYFSRSR